MRGGNVSLLELLKYVFLGLIQGLTEVLPESSSGHVAIFQKILSLDMDEGILFLALINFGSLLAIITHFRKLLRKLIHDFFSFIFKPKTRSETGEQFHYVLKIAVASIPIGILGYFLTVQIDQFYQKYDLIIVGIGLLVTSTLLFLVRFSPAKQTNQTISYGNALVIGITQPLSLLPGFSRSGITTSTGLLRTLSMETTLTFSYMLYIPLSFGSIIRFLILHITQPVAYPLITTPEALYLYIYYVAAFLASIIATILALKFIFKFFRQGKLVYFAIYTMVIGLLSLGIGVWLH
jgi:undecaprenyl-diphosphatase